MGGGPCREREKLSDVECHGPQDGIKSAGVTGNSERANGSAGGFEAARNTGSHGPGSLCFFSYSHSIRFVSFFFFYG